MSICWHLWGFEPLIFVLVAAQILVVSTESRTSSVMSRSRQCLRFGGSLDFWSQNPGQPTCIFNGGCPAGSELVSHQCVAPEKASQARAIAVTLQIGCDRRCLANEGMDLSSSAWVALARLLRIPLQEAKASMLFISSDFLKRNPLEYFVIRAGIDSSLIDAPGAAVDTGEAWNLFLALRVESARIGAGSMELETLMKGDISSLVRMSMLSGSNPHIFAAKARQTSIPSSGTSQAWQPYFKLHGYNWNERPQRSTSPPSPPSQVPSPPPPSQVPSPSPPSQVPSPPPSPQQAPAPPPSQSATSQSSTSTSPNSAPCYATCQPAKMGDGKCDSACNNQACQWDLGDCTQQDGGASSSTSDHLQGCGCQSTWLGNGICETFCNYEACLFDGGDCSSVGATEPPLTPRPLAQQSSVASPTSSQCECSATWVGDGTCDNYCNTQACDFDGGDCLQGQSSSQSSVASSSSGLRGSVAAPPEQDGQVVGLQVQNEENRDTWRVVASDKATGKWYIDEEDGKDEEENQAFFTVFAIAIIFTATGVLAVIASCVFMMKSKRARRASAPQLSRTVSTRKNSSQPGARRPSWFDPPTQPQTVDSQGRMESKKSNSSNISFDCTSTASTEAPSSQSSTPFSRRSSDSSFSPTKDNHKEAKIWPEPEQGTTPPLPRFTSQQEEVGMYPQRSPSHVKAATPERSKASKIAADNPFLDPNTTMPGSFEGQTQSRPGTTSRKTVQTPSKPPVLNPEDFLRDRVPQKTNLWHSTPFGCGGSATTSSAKTSHEASPNISRQSPKGDSSAKAYTQGTSAPNSSSGAPTNTDSQSRGFFSGLIGKTSSPQPGAVPTHKSPPTNSNATKKAASKASTASGWFKSSATNQNPPPATSKPQNAKPSRSEVQAQKATDKKATSLSADMMKRLDQARSKPVKERKKVFRDLQRELHPDKNIDQAEAAKLAFQRLMEQRESFLTE